MNIRILSEGNMKRIILMVSMSLMAGSVWATKDCDELINEIDAKIRVNGVSEYALEILDVHVQTDKPIVGTCGGGSKKIVYQRGEDTADGALYDDMNEPLQGDADSDAAARSQGSSMQHENE